MTHAKDEHTSRYYFQRIILPAVLFTALVVGLTLPLIFKTPATTMTGTGQTYTATETRKETPTTAMETSVEYPKAPSFQLREYGSDRIVSMEDFIGRPVFLEFFLPTCPVCLSMIPKVEQLYEKYGDRIVFIIVSPEELGGVKEVYGIKPIVLLDSRGEVFMKYKVKAVPTFFILDREHRVLWSVVGGREVEELESAIQRVL